MFTLHVNKKCNAVFDSVFNFFIPDFPFWDLYRLTTLNLNVCNYGLRLTRNNCIIKYTKGSLNRV